MTYEEYKESKNPKKGNGFKRILSKLFTVVIFSMIVIIVSNMSSTFRSFLINDVLNSSMDFSKANRLIDYFTNVFKDKESVSVFNEFEKKEVYKDGIKYFVNDGSSVILKDSGIVTYIGNMEGYGNTIIIQQSNGYYAWYCNVKESIKLYDYISSGEEVGISNGEYYIYVLYKDEFAITNED